MASLTALRPQTTSLPLRAALDGTGPWNVWTRENGHTATSATIADLPVSGVSVSTDDLDTDWVFVGIPGASLHGAALAEVARLQGASVIVTDAEGAPLAAAAGLPIIVVDDPRTAAGRIAENLYRPHHADLVVAGVTGTNGKTTTTYFLRAALSPKLGRMGLLGTLEVDTGDYSTRAERTTHEAPVVHRALAATAEAGLRGAVVEVSSHALSLGRVEGVHFSLGVFTNLQHDHLDFYDNSMDLYFEAKSQLFTSGRTDCGVTAVDDEYGRRLARSATIPMQAVQVLTNDVPDVGDTPLWKVTDIHADRDLGGSRFLLTEPSGAQHQVACPIPGLVNVQDAALAIVGAHSLGVTVAQAASEVRAAPPVPGRMQWVRPPAAHLPTVLIDYAHTPEALERLLIDIRPLVEGDLILVFGTDGDRDATKRVPLGQMAGLHADRIWITDENPRWENPGSIRAELRRGITLARPSLANVTEITSSRRDAIREAIYAASPEDIVVVSGKGAETYQEVRGVRHQQTDAGIVGEVFQAYQSEPTGRDARAPLDHKPLG